MTRAMITKDKEELVKLLVEYHVVPYRNRQSAAEELAEEICTLFTVRFLQGLEKARNRDVADLVFRNSHL